MGSGIEGKGQAITTIGNARPGVGTTRGRTSRQVEVLNRSIQTVEGFGAETYGG